MKFLLSKWYLDCISEDGKVFIGYSASLRWKSLKMNYSSILKYRDIKGIETKTSIGGYSLLEASEASISWSHRRLGLNGTWNAVSLPIKKKLYDSDAGFIEWTCMQPLSRADICMKGLRISGLGYAEHLMMSIKPWSLPIDELRWGRFHAGGNYLVWIEWRGPKPLTIAFYNGTMFENVSISDRKIKIDGGKTTLELDESLMLREGPLISTVFSKVPVIQGVLARHIPNMHECKWRSRGELNDRGVISMGWAIHEVVKWH